MRLLLRFAQMIPLLLVVSFAAFLLVRLAPGGPFDRERRPATPEIEAALRAKYRLDEPLLVQFRYYLQDVLRGDFGPSLKYRNHSVNDIIAQGLPVSLTLGGAAFLMALGLGIPVGVITAVRKGGWQDTLGTTLALLAVCIPSLVLAPVLIVALGIHLRWFPVALWGSPLHAVLPSTVLALYFAGRVARLTREGVLGILKAEFVMAARAKGLSENAVLARHVLRPALLPVVSYSGPMLADLLTGSFVVENLFQIPGIGVFLVNSSINRDYPMIVGLVILYATLLIFLNLIVDLAYGWFDPRSRAGARLPAKGGA